MDSLNSACPKDQGHSLQGFDSKKTGSAIVEEMTNTLARSTLGDISNEANGAYTLLLDSSVPQGPPPPSRSCQLVKDFLLGISADFARVSQLRDRGWYENKAEGDAYFKRQRERADNADDEARKRFHEMMLRIADEMERVTGALRIKPEPHRDTRVLDICMAPGGYTIAALKYNPKAKVYALTLPEEQGGHPIIIDKGKLAGCQMLDVTRIIKEFWDGPIPQNHPDRSNFIPIRPFKFYKFALVFCDGMVLRTQDRPSYRQDTEITRLACSQLILAMQRVQAGGTIVMLLHKVDSWPSAQILYAFSKFAHVQVFKPSRAHASRSSFYMVAKEIDIEHEDAIQAILEWKRIWYQSTFGGPDGLGVREDTDDSIVQQVLSEFGERLAKLGSNAWKIQADTLSKTNFAVDPLEKRTQDASAISTRVSSERPESTKFKLGRESRWESDSSGPGFKERRPSNSAVSGPGSGWKERRESITSMESWRDRSVSITSTTGSPNFENYVLRELKSAKKS